MPKGFLKRPANTCTLRELMALRSANESVEEDPSGGETLWAAAFRRAIRLSSGHVEQSLHQRPDFPLAGPAGQSLLDFPAQHLALQRLALVGVRRPARLVVPGAGAAVADLLVGLVPGPRLHQRIHPQV